MISIPDIAPLPAQVSTAKAEFYPNGTYGDAAPDKTFDFYRTTVFAEPAPVIVYVHGGGFISGDKDFVLGGDESGEVVKLLNAGFSVISINYPLLEENETIGVIKCLDAIEEAIADIRAAASTLNIDPNRVGYRGKSAGSAAGMYLAGRPNPPNAIAVSRPMPLNVSAWHEHFATIDLDWMLANFPARVYQLFGLPYTPPAAASDFDAVADYMSDVDSLANLASTLELRGVWIHNSDSTAEPTDFGTLVHHPNFSAAFDQKLRYIGYQCEYHRSPTPGRSISEFFRNTLFPVAESEITASMYTRSFTLSAAPEAFAEWFPGIRRVRFFRADFSQPKGPDNVPTTVDDSEVSDFVDMCQAYDLEVIYTLMVSSVTLASELAYVNRLITEFGMPIVAFEYGGEFYLQKYRLGDLDNPKVIEKIDMTGANEDYLTLLDTWVPAFTSAYPSLEHIVIGASHGNSGSATDVYRRDHWNDKVFGWLTSNAATYGHLPISFHLYAGNTIQAPDPDEEDIIQPEDLDFTFLHQVPEGHAWVFTEGNFYVTDNSPYEMSRARAFWQRVWNEMRVRDRFGVFALYSETGPLGLFDSNGVKPLGSELRSWLNASIPNNPRVKRWRNYSAGGINIRIKA